MCNSDITVEILEKAIEDAENSKPKGGVLSGLFGSSPQKAKPQPAPSRMQPPPPPGPGSRNNQATREINRAESLRVRDIDSADSGREDVLQPRRPDRNRNRERVGRERDDSRFANNQSNSRSHNSSGVNGPIRETS